MKLWQFLSRGLAVPVRRPMQPGRKRAQLRLETLEDRRVMDAKIALVPNDPSYLNNTQWDLNGAFGVLPENAWNMTTGSTSVVVAINDTGIDYRHPDLYRNIYINQNEIPASVVAAIQSNAAWDIDSDGLITFWDLNDPSNQGAGKITDLDGDLRITAADILQPIASGGWEDDIDADNDGFIDNLVGWNFITDTNDPLDDNGHGTHVAGTIGAVGNDGVGIAGLNWRIQMMPVKMMDSTGFGTSRQAAAGVRYSINQGATISNNSWTDDGDGNFVRNAVSYATGLGQLFVAAAGNNALNIDTTPIQPAAYSFPNVFTVASSTTTGAMSSFSNYGVGSVDIAAPGSGIYSTLLNGTYGLRSGTSMATPHVAGAAALVKAYNPTWTAQDIKNYVMAKATPSASWTGVVASGGRLDLTSYFQAGPFLAVIDDAAVLHSGFNTVDLGTTYLNTPVDRTITVRNLGTSTLTLTNPGALPAGFSLASGFSSTSLAPGDSATLVLRLTGASRGTFSGTVTFGSNDPSQTSFSFNVSGSVVNRSPVLGVISNQSPTTAQLPLVLTLNGADPDSDALTYSAQANSYAYYLDQTYGLLTEDTSYFNWGGQNEKWLNSSSGQWYFLLPNGNFVRWNGSGSASGTVLASLATSYYTTPATLYNAPAGGVPVNLTVVGNQLTIDPLSFTGTFAVTASVTDSFASDSKTFLVTITNLAPTLAAIPDQTMPTSQNTLDVALTASDPEGQSLTFSASANTLAYYLDQTYGLTTTGNLYLNYGGQNEKWLQGTGGVWYIVKPSGQFVRWNGVNGSANGTLLATLDPYYYTNINQLYNATAGGVPVTFSFTGNTLTIDPNAGITGNFHVTITASDGTNSVSRSFFLSVTAAAANQAPTLAPLSDTTISTNQDTVNFTLNGADPESGPLTYSATVRSQAYQLDQTYTLTFSGNSYYNYGGRSEKWMQGSGGRWFFILPTGDFYQWNGAANQATGTFIANLETVYYDNIALLYNATVGASASVSGNTLTVDPAAGFIGKLTVTATVTDNAGATATRTFVLTVSASASPPPPNTAPSLAAIADQSVPLVNGSVVVPLSATDPDGPSQTFSATVESQAYRLKTTYGLFSTGNIYLNWGGRNEKWAQGSGGRWYFLLPDGRFYLWNGSAGANGTLIDTLETHYYTNFSQLYNATAGATAAVAGTNLTVTFNSGFIGKLYVTVTVSDSIATDRKSFVITVT
jgi:subtilisin family serine protease